MTMIFPGMDPYLENPQLFPGIHSRMVVYMADQMLPALQPRYIASVCERVYVEGPQERPIVPDVWIRGRNDEVNGGIAVAEPDMDEPVLVKAPELEIREPYIEILDRDSGMRVVTVIELVSPFNKYAGPGREAYLAKQQEILHSPTHLVEIDLLRRGPHVLAVPLAVVDGQYEYHYLVSVSRAQSPRNSFEVYPRTVRQPLPRIRIPLADDDPDVRLDIRAALEQAFHAGSYRQRIDYKQPCQPPLIERDQAWADELIQAARL